MKIRVQSHSSRNRGFKRNPCEQPHHERCNSSGACLGVSPSAQPGAPDPGQASHALCDFLHHHKSLLIPSKPFLVSIKAQLPPCFAQQGLVQPHGAGTTGRAKAEQVWLRLWTGLPLHPCTPDLISWLI